MYLHIHKTHFRCIPTNINKTSGYRKDIPGFNGIDGLTGVKTNAFGISSVSSIKTD